MCAFCSQMKLAAIVVVLVLLFYFEPITAQGKRMKVLRMCKSRFSKCQSQKRFKRDYKRGARCCGRAWTVRREGGTQELLRSREFSKVESEQNTLKSTTKSAAYPTDFNCSIRLAIDSRIRNPLYSVINRNFYLEFLGIMQNRAQIYPLAIWSFIPSE